ncbi:unnamed protein product [Rotaria sordida]|uniref:FBA domain-containing protein n=1 Tax=Rotaria sordida TaxID=392033 RepID=A0A814NSN1_9BILA|nr:unnamed protein product [Rotaria sordida]CAF1146533.1 unnamed protein product [Rotaria sordida]CAF1381886.1 unnamed protein product [Rotaria sordida]
MWGQFFQPDIQLLSGKLSWQDVACFHPIIEFSICVAPRWDCASECRICLTFSDGHRWECERNFPQWNDKKWHRLIYHYKQYQQFPTSVTVLLSGKDRQFWAGYYGVKFAQTRLRLLLHTDENETNQESEIILEPKDEDEFVQGSEPDPVHDDLPVDDNFVDQDSSTSYSTDRGSEPDDD